MEAPVIREDLGGQARLLWGAVQGWAGLQGGKANGGGERCWGWGKEEGGGVGVAMAVDLDLDMEGVRVGSGQGKDLDSGELSRLQV